MSTRRWTAILGGLRERVRRSGRMGPVALVLAALLVSLVTSLFARRPPPVPQPIAFNHLRHTGELQLPCDFCHKYVRTGAHSGLPGRDTCSLCHLTVQGETQEAARLTELLQSGEPLAFNKLFRLPDHVFYTHRRHVAIGELDCTLCHGGIAETEEPPERALVEIKMAYCVECHGERGVTTDCTACHR